MKKEFNPEASILAQLLLMQDVLINLPSKSSILSFVCKGLEDIPGVKSVHFLRSFKNQLSKKSIHIPIGDQKEGFGSLHFKLDNALSFQLYDPYVRNFIFMIQIILKERSLWRLTIHQKLELEKRVKELKKAKVKAEESEQEIKKYRDHLEEKVIERTKDLEEEKNKLDNAVKVFVGREIRIRNLEKEFKAYKNT